MRLAFHYMQDVPHIIGLAFHGSWAKEEHKSLRVIRTEMQLQNYITAKKWGIKRSAWKSQKAYNHDTKKHNTKYLGNLVGDINCGGNMDS
mgnify:FL=1